MKWPSNRTLIIGSLTLSLLIVVGLRCYFQQVPRGVTFTAWVLGRVDGPVLKSPDGKRELYVYFNDGGAMHSGNHWTWIVEDSAWFGRYVVAEGFVGADIRFGQKPLPAVWDQNGQIHVEFLQHRYNSGTEN